MSDAGLETPKCICGRVVWQKDTEPVYPGRMKANEALGSVIYHHCPDCDASVMFHVVFGKTTRRVLV